MIKPSLQKLQKFFKLEAERGYDNHAVLGGLERILERWEPEARADNLPEDLIQVVNARLRDYPRLTTASRAEVLEGLSRRIQREVEGNSPASAAVPKKPTEPVSQSGRNRIEPTFEGTKVERPASPPPPPQTEAIPAEAESRAGEAYPEETPAEEETTNASETVDEVTTDEEAQVEPRQPESRPVPVFTRSAPSGPPAALNAPVTVLPGVGPRHAITLGRLGLRTLGDMLYYLPRRYDDYSRLKPINRLWYGEDVTVIGSVQSIATRPVRSGRGQIVEAVVSDGTGALRVTWFNQPWLTRRLHGSEHISLSGKIEQYLGRLVMNNPEWEPLEEQQLSTNRIVPVYPLTAQITQRWLRRLMNQVVTYWAPRVQDPLLPSLRHSAGLMDLPNALLQAHFPDSAETLKAARLRLAFDEIFLLQLGVLSQKRAWQERPARIFSADESWLQGQVERLPFPLTGAQQRSVEDVMNDLRSGRPMNRLLQGDVGSGKTVVAALAMAMVIRQGSQAAIMAPTSILAEQHYKRLRSLLADGNLLQDGEICLMVGATSEAEKNAIRLGLADGTIKAVVGTHALLEDPVVFKDLQLVIVDEQHRFGVEQRAVLRSKGDNPHLLVMTATPIPRSLALTVYGDLDLSVMDEMPPGRQPVSTHVLTPRELERAYALIRSQVQLGRQAFIIYPLVEESDKSDSKAAVEEHARLQKEIFPKLKLGLLHGRMKSEEKDEIMARFRDGQYHILVSTSVVEVGVDVTNATVMLIEGANRFGLAQLHQFRGRVGRGGDQAYCLLVPETPDAVENERLQVMVETTDGFVLAERDLDQRGPGQFLGTRQSGYSELRLASLTDIHLIEKARHHAQALFETDPDLAQPEHQPLAESLRNFWNAGSQNGKGDIS
ncbi:MAG TPA: ATP-dependent DNA helicase RecG [Anaerolineales bacterium]